MRKISCVIGALFLIAGAFAKGGVLAGAGKLSVMQTTYFDIIFPIESAEAAHKIAAVADGYYEEISALFHAPCNERFPVTITHGVESLNAYFAAAPYNRIVLRDAPPDEDLDMHTQTLESVFYHELTHAVTTNIRSPVAAFLSAVLGDWLAPAGFLQTSFMLEGAAVSFESLGGEGRVYDPYNTQLVQQAKLDGRFPSWRDVTGARDTFPGGTDAYAFGALFCQFLQETYGMEAYAAFWHTTGSFHGFKRSIKKTYGKPIAELWNDFEAWVTVPPATEAISFDGGTDDFFVANGFERAKKTGFSRENSQRTVFSCLDSSAHGVVWHEKKTGGVWYAALQDGALQKPKKLFTCAAVSRLSLSDDGAWLSVSYLYADANTKRAVALYHFPTGKLMSLPLASVRDAGFVREKDGSLLLSCVNIAHDTLSLDFYTVGTHAKDLARVKQLFFAKNEIPFSPCAAEDGGCACIVKSGMDWTIRLYHADGSYRAYGGAKTVIHHLHGRQVADARENKRLAFSFSYAAFGGSAFPRAGLLYVRPTDFASELVLQNDDVSGSVLDAVLLPTAQGERLLYTAAFYDTHRLMQMDFSRRKLIRHQGSAPQAVVAAPRADATKSATTAEKSPADATNSAALATNSHPRSYHPLRYYRHGMLLPVGMVNAYDRDELDDYVFGYTNVGSAFVGATYGSANPWGDKIAVVSGGWNPFDKNGGVYLDYSGGTDTFSYDVNGTVLFDGSGFMQTTEGISLGKTLYNRFGNAVMAGATGAYFYGHGTDREANGWASRAQTYLSFSTVHKHSPRYADSVGVTFQPFVFWERVSDHYVNAGATVRARIPGFVPLSLSATLFPSAKYVASASATVYLFTWEVQKGILPALYLDRLYLTASYTGILSYEHGQYFDIKRTVDIFQHITKDDYSDTVEVTFGTIAAVNAGFLSRVNFDVGVSFFYCPSLPQQNEKKYGVKPPRLSIDKMRIGVSARLVY